MDFFLIRNGGKKQKAHIWLATDTACRMWSTGGLRSQKDYSISPTLNGHEICHMCQVVTRRLEEETTLPASPIRAAS